MLKAKMPKAGTLLVLSVLLACYWGAVEYSLLACEATYPPAERYQSGYEKCPIPRAIVDNAAVAFFRFLGNLIHDFHDELIALATVAIAWFTWTLRRSTDRLWEAGEKQLSHAKEIANEQLARMTSANNIARYAADGGSASAQAAKEGVALARQQFMAAHRPELVIHSFVPIIDGDEPGETVKVMIVYFNKGRGVAKDIERYGYITNIKTPLTAGIEPPQIDSPRADIEPGERRTLLVESTWDLSATQFAATSAPKEGPWLICIGKIVYRDGAGVARELGFSRRLYIDPNPDEWLSAERWVPVEGSEYEYSY